MSKRPGVMIYFDMLPVLRTLSNTDKGILFEAILEYGANKKEIELTKKTAVIWPLILQRMTVDEIRYNRTFTRRAYASYRRGAKQQGEEPLEFIQWQQENGQYPLNEDYDADTNVFLPDD